MENDRNKEREHQRPTPIIDGDARPDMPIDNEEALKEQREKKKNKNSLTINRASDVNSLEDYKDEAKN